jgi:hypothetical protein
MCFGKTKTPSYTAPPPPSPAPSPIAPTEVKAVSEDERRQKLGRLRQGLASTIKSQPKGMLGGVLGGSDSLINRGFKQTLGT